MGASVRWLLEYWRQRAQQTPLNAARRRKIVADATRAELDVAAMQARLAPIEVAAQALAEARERIRTRLRAIPSTAAPEAHRATSVIEVRNTLQRAVDGALLELAEGARQALGRSAT